MIRDELAVLVNELVQQAAENALLLPLVAIVVVGIGDDLGIAALTLDVVAELGVPVDGVALGDLSPVVGPNELGGHVPLGRVGQGMVQVHRRPFRVAIMMDVDGGGISAGTNGSDKAIGGSSAHVRSPV